MTIHTLGGVNYRTRHAQFMLFSDDSRDPIAPEDVVSADRTHLKSYWSHVAWYCRWELPMRDDESTIRMHGAWVGPFTLETTAVAVAQEDFVECADEGDGGYINTESVNDR